MVFCVMCGAELRETNLFCSNCGQRKEVALESLGSKKVRVDSQDATEASASVSMSPREHYERILATRPRYLHVPITVFRDGQPVNYDYERTLMTTLAFKRVAESALKTQLNCIIVGSLIAIISIAIAIGARSAAAIMGLLLGVLVIGFGLRIRPNVQLRLSKAYCSLSSVPYDKMQLVFDLNGYIGYQRFDYATIDTDEISSNLRELPRDLAIENENLLIEKLNEITKIARKSKQDSLSLPVAPKDHVIVACMKDASGMCLDGRPENELPAPIGLEDCLKYVVLLQSLERSKDIVSFLDSAATQCVSGTSLFTRQLETNLHSLEEYFNGLTESLKQRLFGGISYKKAKDNDVEDVFSYDASKVPDFANIVRPFETVIESLYQPVRNEIEKLKRDFEMGKSQLLRDLERDQRRIDMDTEREVRSLQREIEVARQHVESVRSRKNSLEAEIDEEESIQQAKDREYRDWSYVSVLRSRLSGMDAELRAAEDSVSRLNKAIADTQDRAQREKRHLQHETDRELEDLKRRTQKDIKDLKSPILKLQRVRDQVIDLASDMLSSLQTEKKIQRAPYVARLSKIAQARDAAALTLKEHSELRIALINSIKNIKTELPFKGPTQVSIPFWFLEISNKKGVKRFSYCILDFVRLQQIAQSWTRDFVEFVASRAPFSSYVQLLGPQVFEQASRYALSTEELLSAARAARVMVDERIISEHCYTKMIEFFGGTPH